MMAYHVLIVGAGAGGTAIAAHLVSVGYSVTITEIPGFTDRLEKIHEFGDRVLTDGMLCASGNVSVAHDPSTVSDIDFVVIATVADAHSIVADLLASIVSRVRGIVFFPGNLGSLFLAQKFVGDQAACPMLVESNTMPYGCRTRVSEPNVSFVSVLTPSVLYSGEPSRVPGFMEMLTVLSPNLVVGGTNASVLLSNPNPLFHPTSCLLSASGIEANQQFRMYQHGITESVLGLLRRKDEERMRLMRSVAGRGLCWEDMRGVVNVNDTARNMEFLDCGRAAGFDGPHMLTHRYLVEDTAAGLVSWERIGTKAGILTPIISAEITLISALLNKDFRAIGKERADLL